MGSGTFLSNTMFSTQFCNFLAAQSIGSFPLAVLPDGTLSYGDSYTKTEQPKPIIHCERSDVVQYAKLSSRSSTLASEVAKGEGKKRSFGDRFISIWDDVRSKVKEADELYGPWDLGRLEMFEAFVQGIGEKGFQYAAKAMIAEYDAAQYERQKAVRVSKDTIHTAAIAWLNFVHSEKLFDAFGRYIVSHATLYAYHSEDWPASRLLLVLSARLYVGNGNFEKAAHDQMRAALAHSRALRFSSGSIVKHIEDAIGSWGSMAGGPPDGAISGAQALRDAALQLT